VTHEEACRRVAQLYEPRWLRHYVASKLRRDGIFARAFELLRESPHPILDLGCGVGLLPFYLRARGCTQAVIGIDIDRRKLERARAIVATGYDDITFLEQDASGELPDFCGNVTMFDVLHYLTPPKQESLLHAVALRVAPGAMLLIRDCPRDGSARFYATYVAERFAQAISWNIGVPLHFPARDVILRPFRPSEFTCDEQPMWGGGPFNNRLYLFRRRSSSTVQTAG
jgi:2-polyprenyl-3-methyl-5-hydroxy-6-metoxy-1,4-benzoquinol methylase